MSTIWSVHFQLLLQLSCAFVCCTLCVTDVFVCIGVNSRSLWLWDKFLGGIQVCDWSFVLWCFHLSWVAVISMYNHDENPNLLNVMILHSYIHIWKVLMCRVLDPEDIWGEDSAEILRQDPENLKVGCCTNAVYKDRNAQRHEFLGGFQVCNWWFVVRCTLHTGAHTGLRRTWLAPNPRPTNLPTNPHNTVLLLLLSFKTIVKRGREARSKVGLKPTCLLSLLMYHQPLSDLAMCWTPKVNGKQIFGHCVIFASQL